MLFFLYFNIQMEALPLIICLNFSSILIFFGLVGIIFNKQNILKMLLCIELMFFSISLNFVFFSLFLFNILGQIFCLFIITVVASETSIGLSLLIIASRLNNKINYNALITLRG